MNKYSLIIEEHIEGSKDFHTKPIITIEGNSIVELLGKFPLQLHVLYDNHIGSINNKIRNNNIADEDIPF